MLTVAEDPFGLSALLIAASAPASCFVVGAGASSPAFPVVNQLPTIFAAVRENLHSFPAHTLPLSKVRELLNPALWHATNTLEGWKIAQMTSKSVALVLGQALACARARCPAQYRVFRLFNRSSMVISFNWDGLTRRCCPQRPIIEVHGSHSLRLLDASELDELLWWTQMDEDSDGTDLLPGLVLPGTEDSTVSSTVRRRAETMWLRAQRVIVVGYSFGWPTGAYDTMWREMFLDVMRRNPVPIHIVSPNPEDVVTLFRDALGSRLRVHGHALYWHPFAKALISLSTTDPNTVAQAVASARDLTYAYERLSEKFATT